MRTLSDKEVKTRKWHQCVWCGEGLEAGETAQYRSYIFQGDFTADYLHPECYDAMYLFPGDLEDGFDVGAFKRGTYNER